MLRELQYTSVHSTIFKDTIPSSQSVQAVPGNHQTRSIVCTGCGNKIKVVMNCGDRTCPYCREKSVKKSLSKKGLLDRRIEGLRFMTLTVKSVAEFNREEIDKIRDYFRHLIRRKLWKKYVLGGMYVIEVTHTNKGYHIHLHILYSGKWFPWAQLMRIWKEITDGSYIIWISKVKDSTAAMNYVLGYISKVDKSNVDKTLYLKVVKGIKLLQFFGTWVKMHVQKKPCTCKMCQGTEWMLDLMLLPKFFNDYDWFSPLNKKEAEDDALIIEDNQLYFSENFT